MHPSQQTLVLLVLVPFIVWRVYRRVSRMVGRQKFSPIRQWLSVCLFSLLTVFLGSLAARHPDASLLALAGGVVLGTILGVVGYRLTRFEQTAEGFFYTPNAHLGIALSLLLVGRIFYRFIGAGFPTAVAGAGAMPPVSASTPLTLALFGMLAGYYVTYAAGLIMWRRGVQSGA